MDCELAQGQGGVAVGRRGRGGAAWARGLLSIHHLLHNKVCAGEGHRVVPVSVERSPTKKKSNNNTYVSESMDSA